LALPVDGSGKIDSPLIRTKPVNQLLQIALTARDFSALSRQVIPDFVGKFSRQNARPHEELAHYRPQKASLAFPPKTRSFPAFLAF
jgi:hypothetical protein